MSISYYNWTGWDLEVGLGRGFRGVGRRGPGKAAVRGAGRHRRVWKLEGGCGSTVRGPCVRRLSQACNAPRAQALQCRAKLIYIKHIIANICKGQTWLVAHFRVTPGRRAHRWHVCPLLTAHRSHKLCTLSYGPHFRRLLCITLMDLAYKHQAGQVTIATVFSRSETEGRPGQGWLPHDSVAAGLV